MHRWTPPDDVTLDLTQLMDYLITEGESWIRSQRNGLRPNAAPLTNDLNEKFAPYFQSEILSSVRFQTVVAIENPGFYSPRCQR